MGEITSCKVALREFCILASIFHPAWRESSASCTSEVPIHSAFQSGGGLSKCLYGWVRIAGESKVVCLRSKSAAPALSLFGGTPRSIIEFHAVPLYILRVFSSLMERVAPDPNPCLSR